VSLAPGRVDGAPGAAEEADLRTAADELDIRPEYVKTASMEALAAAPDPRRPIAILSALDGAGPATALALVAAARPETYAFFDELVAAQVPALGKVAWTLGYYLKYAAALSERAAALGGGWTPAMVERALWAHSGGKAGA